MGNHGDVMEIMLFFFRNWLFFWNITIAYDTIKTIMYDTIYIYIIWLVVTGTMEFYDFPFSWEFHHPN